MCHFSSNLHGQLTINI